MSYLSLLPEDIILQIINKLNVTAEQNLNLTLSRESCVILLRLKYKDLYDYIKSLGHINLFTTEDYSYIRYFHSIKHMSDNRSFVLYIDTYFHDHFKETVPPVLALLMLKFNAGKIYNMIIEDSVLLSSVSHIAYDFISFYRQRQLTAWHPCVLSLIFGVPFELTSIEYTTLYDNSLYLLVLIYFNKKGSVEAYNYYRDVIWK